MGYAKSVLTPEAEAFLAEWRDGADTVAARTSGSTGVPKEIRLKKCDMLASARATVEFFGLGPSSLLLLPLSTSYIAGKMQVVRALVADCALVAEQPSSSPLSRWQGGRISLLPVVPSQLPGLMSSPAFGLIDNLIIGGAPLSPDAESSLVDSGVKAYATYGMTETCSHVALRRVGTDLFKALPGFTFSTDERGCLVIDSSSLSFGRLVTNDVVKLCSPQSFVWKGRADNVINSGGVKIHPEEVEKVLLPMLPSGVTAYVTSRRSDRWGEEAVVVTDSPLVTSGLLSRLRRILGPIHCPKDVIVLPEIPRTDISGKIKREKF